ncbi:MAG: Ig-like domain-containing protein, partial [Anaerolineales bacterium]|nr:Ig-like domain-containing protein [Anaerolineales bacterium]
TGAHTNITLTNNPTLVDGAIYTISFDAKDLGENAATTISNTSVTYDVTAPTISSISPATSSYVNHAKVSYTLSESLSSGTVTWTRTGGSADSNSPHAKALTGDELNTGTHTDITLTNSPTLIDGAIYTVSFGATDLAGNSATIVSSTGITYDITPPVISSTDPSQSSYINNTNVSYTLSEAAASGTIAWIRTGGSEDSNSPHAQALAGTELNSGSHTDITLTNSPTLVDGAMYTISFDATDAAANAATTVSTTGITYDVTSPTLLQVTPAKDSFLPIADNSKIRIDFSEPITAYNVDASSKFGTNLNTSIQQASDSLVISVNAPLTSLDTLTFKVTNLTDRGGTVGDAIEISYQTSILADYNNDYKVDIQDLANFVSLWPNLDLGPANGTIPYLTPEMDGLANLRDVGIFTRMWHW